MLFKLESWAKALPDIKTVFYRFPVALLFSLSAVIVSILLIHDVDFIDKDDVPFFYFIMSFGVVSQISFKLFVESDGWSAKKTSIGSVVVIAVTIFYAIALIDNSAFASTLFFALALGLSFLFSPYIKRASNENSVWYFNYQTGVAMFFGAISAIVFGGGLSLVVLSVGYLFEVEVPDEIYGDIWVVAWGLLFVVYVLSNLSREYDFKDEGCDFPKGISFIANYILSPLMFVYMAVLYIYVFKILMQWELPKGNLGWMISSFGIIGVITKLVSFPIRHKGTWLMALFDRYFYYALIVPVLMLFVAIFIRINDYGVTEQRYAVVLLGVWLLGIIFAATFLKNRFNIKYVPMSLAVLALLASYGPWSAVNVSVNSQLSRFDSLLIKNKLLVDDQVVQATQEVSYEDRANLSSIADYLGGNKWRSRQVRPLFESLLKKEENRDVNILHKISGSAYINLLDLDYVSKWDARRNRKTSTTANFSFTNHYNISKVLVDVSGFDFVGRHTFYLYRKNAKYHGFTFKKNNKREKVEVRFNKGVFSISTVGSKKVDFDLSALVDDLRKRSVRNISESNASEMVLNKTSSDGRLKVRIILEQLTGNVTKKEGVKVTNIRYVLMLGFK